jgi:glutamine amidotransferase
VVLLPDDVKRPQMQWNTLRWQPRSQEGAVHMSDGQPDPCWMYFVHSYWAQAADPADVAATCDYGVEVTAAVQRGRLWATQFHPEKSSANGLRLLRDFVDACA